MSHENSVVMHWDCEKQGCFNKKKRLKFGVFKDCLPQKISFSDIDGIVEIKGNLLLLEWKDHQDLTRGQEILFKMLTRFCPAVVLIVEGDAEDMTVSSIRMAWKGKIEDPKDANLDDLREMIDDWSGWALIHPVEKTEDD